MKSLSALVSVLAFFLALQAGGWTVDSDVPETLQRNLLSDMTLLRGLQGSGATALHKRVFGRVSGENYMSYLNSRLNSVGYSRPFFGKGNMAYVSPGSPNKIWLTTEYGKYDVPLISRLTTFIHEARHTESENGSWPHANCPIPFIGENGKDVVGIVSGRRMEGLPACDYEALGAYGVEVIFQKNIQHFCTNCTAKLKLDAQIYGDDSLKRILGSAKETLRGDLYPAPFSSPFRPNDIAQTAAASSLRSGAEVLESIRAGEKVRILSLYGPWAFVKRLEGGTTSGWLKISELRQAP